MGTMEYASVKPVVPFVKSDSLSTLLELKNVEGDQLTMER